MVVLIEHQTTINPNMPLRIPSPEFFVFYDGENTSFEQQTLKLSNAFKTESNNLELIVHVYNLAEGMNTDFFKSLSITKGILHFFQ